MSTYSTNLKIELIGTGEQVGTWGTTTNSNFTNVFEQAIVGRGNAIFTVDSDLTLTFTDSVASQVARSLYLNVTSTVSLSTTRNLVVPTINKTYIVENNTTGGHSIIVKTSAGTGITVPNGAKATVYVDGTNVVTAFDYLGGNLTVAGNLSVGGALTLTGGLTLNGNVTVGDNASDTLTINSTITSNLIFTDNTYDIGASGATRPRTGYFGTSVITPLLDATSIDVTNIRALDGTASMSIANSTGIATLSKATVIETTDNTNAALRITQLGTGNALLVEDSSNPDSTPFVIDANGNVISGYTTSVVNAGSAVAPRIQVHGAGGGSAAINATSWQSGADVGSSLVLSRSEGTTIGTQVIVDSGDTLGTIRFAGSDGTAFIQAATISSAVDGTPGTNDMPGRLVFSTTADGASSPTERMRIDSAGQIGIGATPSAGNSIRIGKSVTGSVTSFSLMNRPAIQSDVTTQAILYDTFPTTAAASFTLPNLIHYSANQNTFGAGSTVTSQFGFAAGSGLTGATNNYGFYSNIASGTGRWNFYANGTASNYFGGPTIMDVASTDAALRITQTGTGNALLVEDSSNPDSTPFVINSGGQVVRGVTSPITVASEIDGSQQTVGIENISTSNDAALALVNFANSATNSRPAFAVLARSNGSGTSQVAVESDDDLGVLSFQGSDGTNFIRAASIRASVDGTPGTNDMPGRLVFSTTADGASTPTERMRIASHGGVSIGTLTASAGTTLRLSKTITGATSGYGVLTNPEIQSDVTSQSNSFLSQPSTAAASFTLSNLRHYLAVQGTLGVGSTVTNQYGFTANNTLTGATNNYGFYSDIASGTGRWNFYANGTADNYFAGNVGIGTSSPSVKLDVRTASGTNCYQYLYAGGASDLSRLYFLNSSGNAYIGVTSAGNDLDFDGKATLNSSGNLGLGVTPSAWGTYRAIQAGPAASFFAHSTLYTANMAANAYFASGGVATYIGGGFSTHYQQFNGQHQWYNAPSGAAGNAITFTQAMTLDASGRLLVGTTSAKTNLFGSASSELQVEGLTGDESRISVIRDSTTTTTNGGSIVLGASKGTTLGSNTIVASGDKLGSIHFLGADGTGFIESASIAGFVDGTPGTNDMPGRLVFSTTADGASSPTERMRIDSSGNVGIGTSSPSGRLSVSTATSASVINLTNSSGTSEWQQNGNDVYFTNYNASGAAIFRTSGTERMRLDASGNLGLGVTPSAWSSAWASYGVAGGATLAGRSSNTEELYLSANAFNDGSWKYIASNFATQYYQDAGTHVWRTAPSGTAGTAITFTQAMTLDASGYLGIGTSSPAARLSVAETSTSAVAADIVRISTSSGGNFNITCSDLSSATPTWGIQTGSSETLTFSQSTTERMRITSDGYLRMASGSLGIQFNGDTAAANSLNDYEEGTYTPVIFGATTAGTGTYSVQVGRYTKIGNIVTVAGRVIWSAHTGTGIMRLTLPFTVKNIANYYPPGSMDYSNFTVGTGKQGVAAVNYNTTYASFDACDPAGGARANISIDTAADIMFSFTYEV